MSDTPEKADASSRRRNLPFEWKLLMASIVLFVLGFAFEGGGHRAWQPSPRQETLLRIATWNVGSSVEGGGLRLRNEELPQIAAVLTSIDADVVVLQEIEDRQQLQALLELLDSLLRAIDVGFLT